jgi:PAS domain S-box-containing protein
MVSHYAVLSFLSGGLCLAVTVLVFGMDRSYTNRVRASFGALSVAGTIWATTYGLQLVSGEPATATYWATLVWFGAIPASTLWFVFVLTYTLHDDVLTRPVVAALAVEPAVALVLAVSSHPLFIESVRVVETTQGLVVVPQLALGFGIHLVYTFVLNLVSLGLLVQQFAESTGLYRRQVTLLLVSAAFPLVAIAVGVFDLLPGPQVDITPMLLSVSTGTSLLALHRYRLFDVAPVARDVTFEHLSDGVVILDDRRRLVEANPAARTLLHGETPVGAPASSAIPAASTVLALLDEGRSAAEITVEIDGQGRTYEVTHTETPIGNGGSVGHILVFRDITDFQRVEAQFRAVVENSRDIISVLDEHGTRRYTSPSTKSILGYDPEELVGKPAFTLVHPEDRERVQCGFETAMESGDPVREEFRIQRADGTWRTFEAVGVRLLDDPLADSFVVNSRDVTDRQQYEQRLNVFNRVLRHDLRNGVNVILGYADLLESESISPAGERYLDRIEQKAAALAALGEKTRQIDYTLDEERWTRRPVDVATLVRDCVEVAHCDYPEATVSCTLPDELWAFGDDLLEVAVSNLVDNAVEHNDTERPVVDLTLTTGGSDGSDTGWVELAVADNGPGIPESERQVIAEGAETPLEHGSGLGLWLVVWVVDNLNGELRFRDNDPRGSAVTIRLPAATMPGTTASADDDTPTAG